MTTLKRLAILMLLLLLCTSALAEAPALDENGFLTDEGEYVLEDEENGLWQYASQTLAVTVRRYSSDDPKLVWFEADIRCAGDERLRGIFSNPERIGWEYKYPNVLSAEHGVVLGFSDDFYGFRVYKKRMSGVIVRDGKAIANDTYKKETHYLPNLDVLARYPDGTLKAYECNEYTAQQYIDMGVTDTWSFGPILVRDGQLGTLVEKYYRNKEPRQALGMIEPNHYLLVMVQGRRDDSKGIDLLWVANLLKERGVVEAVNLDGGNSASIVFMGKILNKAGEWNKKKYIRTVCSIIGVGNSPSVVAQPMDP